MVACLSENFCSFFPIAMTNYVDAYHFHSSQALKAVMCCWQKLRVKQIDMGRTLPSSALDQCCRTIAVLFVPPSFRCAISRL